MWSVSSLRQNLIGVNGVEILPAGMDLFVTKLEGVEQLVLIHAVVAVMLAVIALGVARATVSGTAASCCLVWVPASGNCLGFPQTQYTASLSISSSAASISPVDRLSKSLTTRFLFSDSLMTFPVLLRHALGGDGLDHTLR
jgi:hypothetical protein